MCSEMRWIPSYTLILILVKLCSIKRTETWEHTLSLRQFIYALNGGAGSRWMYDVFGTMSPRRIYSLVMSDVGIV